MIYVGKEFRQTQSLEKQGGGVPNVPRGGRTVRNCCKNLRAYQAGLHYPKAA